MTESTTKFFTGLGATLAAGLLIFVAILLGTIGGIVAGWVVGLFFSGLILEVLARFNVNTIGLELWQLGGALGFIGGFFKSYTTTTTKS